MFSVLEKDAQVSLSRPSVVPCGTPVPTVPKGEIAELNRIFQKERIAEGTLKEVPFLI